MSQLVIFDEDLGPDAPYIGGIGWAAAQVEDLVVPEALEPWTRWLENRGAYGLDGRQNYLFPTLGATPRWEGDDPERDKAALTALAEAFPAWRAKQPRPEAWAEWEAVLKWAAEHQRSPLIWGY